MAGQAETPRMSDSLTIADHQVGDNSEFLDRPRNYRNFPKGQQPGSIRRRVFATGCGLVENLPCLRFEDDNGGNRTTAIVPDVVIGS